MRKNNHRQNCEQRTFIPHSFIICCFVLLSILCQVIKAARFAVIAAMKSRRIHFRQTRLVTLRWVAQQPKEWENERTKNERAKQQKNPSTLFVAAFTAAVIWACFGSCCCATTTATTTTTRKKELCFARRSLFAACVFISLLFSTEFVCRYFDLRCNNSNNNREKKAKKITIKREIFSFLSVLIFS